MVTFIPTWLSKLIQQRIDEEQYTLNDHYEDALEWVLNVTPPPDTEPIAFTTTHGNRIALSEHESKLYDEFETKHCGTVEIIITFTGVGSKVELYCKGCGERKDITDYDRW